MCLFKFDHKQCDLKKNVASSEIENYMLSFKLYDF
jgi:hypothetical protein